jgi:uncharacterized protein YegJ (DUF2314 family)
MRPLLIALAALGAIMAPAAARAQQDENVVTVAVDDPEMNAAMAEARRKLPDFFAHFANPGAGENNFSVKYDLLPEPGQAEFIWAEVISHSPGVTIARLANNPVDGRFTLGEKVTIRDDEIVDWGYYRDGVMQGHFTTRALLPRLDQAQQDSIRDALNW